MRALLSALVFAACSSSAPVARPPAPPEAPPSAPPIDAAIAVAPADAVSPPPVVSRLVDPLTLPEWPVPAHVEPKAPRPVAIYAADAVLDPLLVALVPQTMPLVALTTGGRVTGRVAAPSREAAYAALAALAPDPAAFAARPPLVGRGASVSLQFWDAPMVDLLRVIADTLRMNIVVAPVTLPVLDVVVARAPADALLARIAEVAGFEMHRSGATAFLIPHGTALPAPIPTHLKGKIVTIDMNGASASDALRAITALTPLAVHVACDTGAKLHLTVRRVPSELAVYAIALASGLRLEPGAPNCPMAPTPTEPPPASALLAIIAQSGIERVALFQHDATRWLVKPVAGAIEIGEGWVTFKQPDTETRGVPLRSPFSDQRDWRDEPSRLAATLIDDHAPAGLLEEPDGTMHTISRTTLPALVVEPGRVSSAFEGRATFERHLESR